MTKRNTSMSMRWSHDATTSTEQRIRTGGERVAATDRGEGSETTKLLWKIQERTKERQKERTKVL